MPRVRIFRSMSQAFRLGIRYPESNRRRGPDTEDRAWPPENAHTGYASCIHALTEPYSSEVGYGTAEAARHPAPNSPYCHYVR
jgi:hypothetical protein